MRYIIETEDGEIFEVTNLFDENGCETNCIALAETCVIKFAEDAWQAALILGRPIHPVQ